jgi:hypothetical protein
MLGRVEVQVHRPDGAWHPVGVIDEAGPLAADIHLLELPEWAGWAPVRVRLELTQRFWRIEHVALVELGGAVEATVLSPVAAERLEGRGPWGANGRAAAAAPDALQARLDPDRYLVTEPGDHFRFTFELPGYGASGAAAGGTYRLFLESTGYYYEGMRPEWLYPSPPYGRCASSATTCPPPASRAGHCSEGASPPWPCRRLHVR